MSRLTGQRKERSDLPRPEGGPPDSGHQLHELRIHQVELEMQNDELREANQRLEEATRRYQGLYDFAPVGYFTLDAEGKILELNLTAVEMLGKPRSELLGGNLFLFLAREDRDILARHLRGVFRSDRALACALHLRSAKGGERHYRIRSQLLGDSAGGPACRSAAMDITAARNVQRKLVAANRLNRSIVQAVADSLVVLDGKLRVLSANTAFYRNFALEPSGIEGRSIWTLSRGRWYPEELRRNLERLAAQGVPFERLELSVRLPGIGRRDLSFAGTHLEESGESSRTILLSIRDLTEQKRSERRIRHAVLRLEEANRQLRQFASVVSHDLKNPLRAIANYAGFLEEDLAQALPEEQRGYLRGILAAVELAEEQITGLLEISRIRETRMECRKIRLGSLIDRLVDTTSGARTEARILCSGSWPTLVTEPTLLRQVLSNLVDNAIKYNPSKSRKVELGWCPLPERQVELYVRDNGPGIAPEHQEKIFLAFRRLHSRKTVEGSGLGLSIVRTAVDRLGGSVRLESEPGKGSTFYVRLPIDGPESDPQPAS
ncbi:MAG: PAS domain-containing protein [Spirochaetales bacterium]|nr:PAS domain-containing protein [Spirochaetales bacterium]